MTAPSGNSIGDQRLPGAVETANPAGTIMVITDNLSSHTSASTRTWLLDHPRSQPAFIPNGACWLNLEEGWWRLFRRQALRTARLLARLERHGWAILHDLAIPGSAANIDHLLIGPGGVVVIDSKQYRGRLRLDQDGLLWHGRHLLSSMLRRARWEADQADEVLGVADLTVAAIVAVHGASVPWGRLEVDGVTVAAARRVPDLLQALPAILGPERVTWLADRARLRFRPTG
jgi:hypothetical protein